MDGETPFEAMTRRLAEKKKAKKVAKKAAATLLLTGKSSSSSSSGKASSGSGSGMNDKMDDGREGKKGRQAATKAELELLLDDDNEG